MEKTFNPCDECEYSYSKQNQESGICRICEFKQLLELEEQGKLLRLPCKVGNIVWANDCGIPCSYEITGYSFGTAEEYIYEPLMETEVIYYFKNSNGSIIGSFAESAIGQVFFLTKAEAEAALEKMKGE